MDGAQLRKYDIDFYVFILDAIEDFITESEALDREEVSHIVKDTVAHTKQHVSHHNIFYYSSGLLCTRTVH